MRAASRSIIAGSSSGRSPWTFTRTSAVERRRDLRQAIGARGMIGTRHDHSAPVGDDRLVDTLVVGGDDHAREPARAPRTLGDVADHRTIVEHASAFPGSRVER